MSRARPRELQRDLRPHARPETRQYVIERLRHYMVFDCASLAIVVVREGHDRVQLVIDARIISRCNWVAFEAGDCALRSVDELFVRMVILQ